MDKNDDIELIATAVALAGRKKDSLRIAKQLYEVYGDFYSVVSSPPDDKPKCEIAGASCAALLSFMYDVAIFCQRQESYQKHGRIAKSRQEEYARRILCNVVSLGRGEFCAFVFVSQTGVFSKPLIFENSFADSVCFDSVEIIRQALAFNAKVVYMAHRHFQGDTTSARDSDETYELVRRLNTFEITLAKHYIVSGNRVVDTVSYNTNQI